MITQKVELNIIPGSIPPILHASQYDTGSRCLQFELYDGYLAYTISTTASVGIVGRKPDGFGFSYDAMIENGLVVCNIEQQMTAVSGDVLCELRISDLDGSLLGTANFILRVEQGPLTDNTRLSDSDLVNVVQAIEYSEHLDEEITKSVDRVSEEVYQKAKYYRDDANSNTYLAGMNDGRMYYKDAQGNVIKLALKSDLSVGEQGSTTEFNGDVITTTFVDGSKEVTTSDNANNKITTQTYNTRGVLVQTKTTTFNGNIISEVIS